MISVSAMVWSGSAEQARAIVLYGTNGHEKGKILVPGVELGRRQLVVRQTEQEGDADEHVAMRSDGDMLGSKLLAKQAST